MKPGTIGGIILVFIAVVCAGYVLFWGTVGAIIIHFVKKFW